MQTTQISIPKLSSMATWRNGFFAAAVSLLGLAGWNAWGAMSYSGAPGADPNAEITGWLMTAGPGIVAAILGFIGRAMGLSPEYVSAMKDFSANPTVAAVEKRALNAAVEFLLPRLGAYPELVLQVLKAIAPSYSANTEVSGAITTLGQSLAKDILTPVVPAPPVAA